jgi:AraC-like DNA-binding protein
MKRVLKSARLRGAAPKFVGMGLKQFSPGWGAPLHAHSDYWEMILIRQGAMTVVIGDNQKTSSVGSIFIYPPNIPHQERCVSSINLEIHTVHFRAPDLVAPPTSALAALPTAPMEAFDRSGHLGDAMAWLDDMQDELENWKGTLDSLLQIILTECSRPKSAPVPDDRFSRVRVYIENNLSEPITVEQLAKSVAMSESRFAHEFRRMTGFSPKAYVRKIRLEHARKMLLGTDTVLREIARQTGFRDEYELSRVFRRVMGVSPSMLRVKKTW